MTNLILVQFGSAQIALTIAMVVFVLIALIAFRINERIQIRVSLLMDSETRTYNRNGFAKYLKKRKNKFSNPSIINVKIVNLGYLYTNYARKDDMMLLIADTMLKGLSKKETLGRVEFNEFLLVLDNLSKDELREKCKEISDRLTELYFENYGIYNFELEFAIYETPNIREYQATIDKALAIIPYSDIRQGNIWYYSQVVEDTLTKFKNVNELKQSALEAKQFQAYVQPKVDYKTGEVCGGEILCRWVDENHTVVFYPDDFIPLFEKNGFIKKLDFEMFDQACNFAQTLKQKGHNITLSVNISKINFDSPTFIDDITRIIQKYPGITPSDLEIEITESANMEGSQHLSSLIMSLRQLGYNLAMDDFGKDYSTLGSLVNCPYDTIKMDMFFFRNRLSTEKEKHIAVNVLKLLSKLNVEIVCEGIEDENTINVLGHITHDFVIQGYYISKPIPLYQFEQFLATHYDFVYPELDGEIVAEAVSTVKPEDTDDKKEDTDETVVVQTPVQAAQPIINVNQPKLDNSEITELRKQLEDMRNLMAANQKAQEEERHNRELEELRREIQRLKEEPQENTSDDEIARMRKELEDLRNSKNQKDASSDELINLQRQIDELRYRNNQPQYQQPQYIQGQPYPYPYYQQPQPQQAQQTIDVEGLIARLKESNRQQLEEYQAKNKEDNDALRSQLEQAKKEREELQRLLTEKAEADALAKEAQQAKTKDEIAKELALANANLDLSMDDDDEDDDDDDDENEVENEDDDAEEAPKLSKPQLSKDEINSIIQQYQDKYQDKWIDHAQEEMGVAAFGQLTNDIKYYNEHEKKSTKDKLLSATPELKKLYNIVKNEFMKYTGVSYKMTNAYDQIYVNKKLVAQIGTTPTKIKVYLAVDPTSEEFANIPHKDASSTKKHAKTPFYVKCKSNLSVRRLQKLIASIMNEKGSSENPDYKPFDYVTSLKYENA